MKKTFLALAAMAMVFATSCNKDNGNTPEEPQDVTDNQFICEIDPTANPQNAPRFVDGIGQMTYIYDYEYVIWEEGDKIAYFGDCTNDDIDGDSWYDLTCESTIQNHRAYFTSDDGYHFGQENHKAYYPASLHRKAEGTHSEGLYLPDDITVDQDHNDASNYLPMYAEANGPHYLTFHNICAVLEIEIPVDNCDKIELQANKNICGSFHVESVERGVSTYIPAAILENDGAATEHNTITLYGSFGQGNYVYVAIPEGRYENFSFKFSRNNNILVNKIREDAMELHTNIIYPVKFESELGE